MTTRRAFIESLPALAGFALPGFGAAALSLNADPIMPDEAVPHKRTWMAFGASKRIWGAKMLPLVQRNLAAIANAIAKYEPVSMLVRQEDLRIAKALIGTNIELIICPLDDLWIRDSGPVFVKHKSGNCVAINFNFNGWGEKQDYDQDAAVASVVAARSNWPMRVSSLVLEGGSIEVDGHGTAMLTESCVLNANRNPGVSKSDCEAEIKNLLGLKKIIWLPGIKGKDITDGHTDFYARFVKPGTVLVHIDSDRSSYDHAVTQRHLEILRKATDARGQTLTVIPLEAPTKIREQFDGENFAAGYVNFYVCNRAVITPEFGDYKADLAAKTTLQKLFPEREIIQINIDGIAAGGGGIHCTTQQEPLVQ